MPEQKKLVDDISDLFDSDVIRGILAMLLVISTIVMAMQGKLAAEFMILTTAVITFYFGQKNGIHQEQVTQLKNCPLVATTVTLEENEEGEIN